MRKYLISVPVRAPLPALDDAAPAVSVRLSPWTREVPLSASSVQAPPMDELLHLEFEDAAEALPERRAPGK